jgi:hypothetical protein
MSQVKEGAAFVDSDKFVMVTLPIFSEEAVMTINYIKVAPKSINTKIVEPF